MTRRFRLGLFVSLAAAVGLHVRPCLLSLVHGEERGAETCPPRATLVALHTADDAPPVWLATGSLSSVQRPALASMCDAPIHVGLRSAVADRR